MTKENKAEEMVRWIKDLLPYMEGSKKWDTGSIWVCESHPLMPYNMGYSFDCKCGGPGMGPIIIPKGDS